jgi:DNA-binding NtrC family response regulator
MIELHPEILEKNGQPAFAVLPYEEFQAIKELLSDYEDLRDLRTAKAEESDAPTRALNEVYERYVGEASNPRLSSSEVIERNAIIQMLKETGGNKLETAKRLGLGRQTLENKVKAYGIEE